MNFTWNICAIMFSRNSTSTLYSASEPTCNMTLRGGGNKIAKIKYHVRENVFLVASVVATVALLAVIMPFSLSIQDDKAQAFVQTSTVMTNPNSMTSPQHDMAMMVMGQDNLMNSEHPDGYPDYSIPNQP